MEIVSYSEDEIPPATEEEIAEMKALAERPDSEIDFSEMPEWDALDFKYAIRGEIFDALNDTERTMLAGIMRLARETERTAKKAQQEATAIAEARISRQLAHQT